MPSTLYKNSLKKLDCAIHASTAAPMVPTFQSCNINNQKRVHIRVKESSKMTWRYYKLGMQVEQIYQSTDL